MILPKKYLDSPGNKLFRKVIPHPGLHPGWLYNHLHTNVVSLRCLMHLQNSKIQGRLGNLADELLLRMIKLRLLGRRRKKKRIIFLRRVNTLRDCKY